MNPHGRTVEASRLKQLIQHLRTPLHVVGAHLPVPGGRHTMPRSNPLDHLHLSVELVPRQVTVGGHHQFEPDSVIRNHHDHQILTQDPERPTTLTAKAQAPHCRVTLTVYEMKHLGRDSAELTALADHLTAHGIALEMLTGPLPGIYDPTGSGSAHPPATGPTGIGGSHLRLTATRCACSPSRTGVARCAGNTCSPPNSHHNLPSNGKNGGYTSPGARLPATTWRTTGDTAHRTETRPASSTLPASAGTLPAPAGPSTATPNAQWGLLEPCAVTSRAHGSEGGSAGQPAGPTRQAALSWGSVPASEVLSGDVDLQKSAARDPARQHRPAGQPRS